MRLGAPLVDEIKSQLLGSLRTVPKTILEHRRQAVDLIAAVQRFSGWFEITWFRTTHSSHRPVAPADFPLPRLWRTSCLPTIQGAIAWSQEKADIQSQMLGGPDHGETLFQVIESSGGVEKTP